MDVFSKKRSEVMSKIKAKNTKPEILIRKNIHKKGFRYRLHDNNLPGCPDIVFPKYNTVVQVRGCFWHLHGCKNSRFQKYRKEYWIPKIQNNRKRDLKNDWKLRNLGWSVIIVWECRCNTRQKLLREIDRITRILQENLFSQG